MKITEKDLRAQFDRIMPGGLMRITEKDLRAQFDRSVVNWPWLRDAENGLGLPPFMLHALGSRETNLRNVNSADGHGRGIWQRDDRSFTIPTTYLDTPLLQATDAGKLLASHYTYFTAAYLINTGWAGTPWLAAVAAYNAGRTGVKRALDADREPDGPTTGGDYASDVIERWSFFVRWGWPLV